MKLGDYIGKTDSKNTNAIITDLKGINMRKEFIPSVANINGTDLSKYKVVQINQFAFNPMHVGRDRLVPISLHMEQNPIIVSPAYITFEIIKPNELIPEYLMEWFRRPDFDRLAWFTTDNSVRGGFSWESLCEMEIDIPKIEYQALILMKDIISKQEELNHLKERIAHWI